MDFYLIGSIILVLVTLFVYINARFMKMQTVLAVTLESIIFSFLVILLGKFYFTHLEQHVLKILYHIHFSDLFMKDLLSFLLFAGALQIDIKSLKKQAGKISLLASLGTVFSGILIGTALYFILPVFSLHIPFSGCVLFGALISPTDPIITLAGFKGLRISKVTKTLIEGESLFNDGFGLIFFLIMSNLVLAGTHFYFAEAFFLFSREVLGGIFYGFLLGFLAGWLIRTANHYKTTLLITLTLVAAGYTFARFMDLSGPLAMVAAGLTIRNFSNNHLTKLSHSWEFIEEILNAILFLLISLLLVIHIHIHLIVIALFAIPISLLARSIVIFTSVRLFSIKDKCPKGITPILIWSGLRGGVSLALAMSLPHYVYRNLIIDMTYAVVAFSIIIQGFTIKPLVAYFDNQLIQSYDESIEPEQQIPV